MHNSANMNTILGDKVNINQVIAKKQREGDSVLRVSTQEVLTYKDKGLSVEEARKRMLEAGEAPKGVARETRKNNAVGAVPPAPPAADASPVVPAVAEPAPIAAPVAPAATVEVVPAPAERGTGGSSASPETVDTRAERIETDRFIGEIKQERGEWAATITFKNGAGTEKFSARTKNELLMKLVEGKANATLRVRAAVRREKLGTAQYDQNYVLPDGVTEADFKAMSESAQNAFIQNLQVAAGTLFVRQHPEYYITEKNADLLWEFLIARNLPLTLRNMDLAYEDLSDDGLLETRPQEPVTVSVQAVSAPAPAPRAEDSAPVVAPTHAAPAAAPIAAPAVTVRTRGSSGLQPGQSSVSNTGLEEQPAASQEPSAAELRAKAPIGTPVRGSALEAEYKKLMADRARSRQRY